MMFLKSICYFLFTTIVARQCATRCSFSSSKHPISSGSNDLSIRRAVSVRCLRPCSTIAPKSRSLPRGRLNIIWIFVFLISRFACFFKKNRSITVFVCKDRRCEYYLFDFDLIWFLNLLSLIRIMQIKSKHCWPLWWLPMQPMWLQSIKAVL